MFNMNIVEIDVRVLLKVTCLIKLETISTLATTVCTYFCSSGNVPLKMLSQTYNMFSFNGNGKTLLMCRNFALYV